jgi:hypothetical protein
MCRLGLIHPHHEAVEQSYFFEPVRRAGGDDDDIAFLQAMLHAALDLGADPLARPLFAMRAPTMYSALLVISPVFASASATLFMPFFSSGPL